MPVVAAREAKYQRAASTPTSASSSSSVMNSPARLLHRDLLAVAHEADPRVEQHLDGVPVEAHRLGGVAEPRDRPVVVGAPDVDQVVEAAAELLGDVADVGGEVGRLAVRAVMTRSLSSPKAVDRNQSAPSCSYTWPPLAQPLDRPLDPALLVEPAPRSSTRRSGRRGSARLRSMPARTRPAAQRPTTPPVSASGGRRRRPDVVGQLRRELVDVVARDSRPRGPARRAGRADDRRAEVPGPGRPNR